MAYNYDSPKSDKGPEPRIDPVSDFRDADRDDKEKKANYEQFTGTGKKKMREGGGEAGVRAEASRPLPSIGYTETNRYVGEHVKFANNQKGSDTLKDPLNTYQRAVKAAVVNPDGERQKNANSYSKPVAAKRVDPAGRSRIGASEDDQ